MEVQPCTLPRLRYLRHACRSYAAGLFTAHARHFMLCGCTRRAGARCRTRFAVRGCTISARQARLTGVLRLHPAYAFCAHGYFTYGCSFTLRTFRYPTFAVPHGCGLTAATLRVIRVHGSSPRLPTAPQRCGRYRRTVHVPGCVLYTLHYLQFAPPLQFLPCRISDMRSSSFTVTHTLPATRHCPAAYRIYAWPTHHRHLPHARVGSLVPAFRYARLAVMDDGCTWSTRAARTLLLANSLVGYTLRFGSTFGGYLRSPTRSHNSVV